MPLFCARRSVTLDEPQNEGIDLGQTGTMSPTSPILYPRIIRPAHIHPGLIFFKKANL